MADYLDEIRSRLEKIVKESNGEYEEADYGLINSELKNFNLLVFRRAKTECSGKRCEPGQDYFNGDRNGNGNLYPTGKKVLICRKHFRLTQVN